MEIERSKQQTNKVYSFLLISGIVLIALNLRPAITSVGPIIGSIQADVGLSSSSAGLLTSLPVIAFAIMSPLAPSLANRLSNEWAMLIGLLMLFIGISIRSNSIVILLFSGTLLVGLGIAVLNVLLPSFIKDKFPHKIGLMTSLYTTAMGVIAAAASGLSVPIADGLNLGWKVALFIWGIPTLLALFNIFYLARKGNSDQHMERKFIRTNKKMWKSPLAWQVAIFMGTQSFLFYSTISWLPTILNDQGVSMATAGWMLSFTQFIGLPASFLVPVIAEKFRNQQGVVISIIISSFLGYGGLLLGTTTTMMVISCTFIGFTLAGAFSLALTLIGLRARTAIEAAELSGMAQTLGYLLAATGPLLIGFLNDISNGWTLPLIVILIDSVIVLIFGLGAGRNKYV
ncbi:MULTISPECIES: CynX/NimT family MFS transporter [Bacillaceae]|uniref:CynX/NimT family MFS transporter n=1 Tax=Bacillaceae TaxID=186817 RepID=UPI0006215322|nr:MULTISPECIES: MFS transporter [Bacillaceae]KKE80224.1 transporter [Bacilli bacterium VT-13-104]PZD88019.1 MFS transporter [Bacilli bacterium]MED4474035.1 MFS transporter [Oceanobacillus caeni]PZD90210.1 MFS transporter [Bacilli bacterium]PZD92104.1 MFS transporter [Bacilli bacterium]